MSDQAKPEKTVLSHRGSPPEIIVIKTVAQGQNVSERVEDRRS